MRSGGRTVVAAAMCTVGVVLWTGGASASSGTWETKASMPTPRAHAVAAEIGGSLYVAGGQGDTSDTPALEAYDPASNTWTARAPLPQGRYETGGAVLGGQLYVVGGWHTGFCCPTSTLYAYDPATNSWTTRASMPILSGCSAVGAIAGKLYVLTACDGFSGYRSFLHVYDPVANSWSQLASAPHAHGDPAAGVMGGKLYVAGGQDTAGAASATLDVYDPLTNTWSTQAPMPTARSQVGGAVLGGKLYAVGGWTGTSRLTTVEAYDPSTNTWSTEPSMPTARYGVSAVSIAGQLYAVGGSTPSGITGTLEVFTPAAAPLPLSVVVNTNDSGPGSLRAAMEFANTDPGADTISFAIPRADSGCSGAVCTIRPTSPLPALSDGGTTIDGSTERDTNPFGPPIAVNGSVCNCTGIVLASDSNRVNDLVVNAFTGGGSGIEIRGSNNSVTGSYVGLDATGTIAVQNSSQGISVLSGTGNVIGGSSPAERNVVSGNNGQGIWLASSGNAVRGNFIGTDRTGTLAIGNGLEGVFIWPCPFANCAGGPAQDNVVGGPAAGDRNVVSGNSDGVWVEDSANLVQGNFVGTDVSGTLPLGNRVDGIRIVSSAGHVGVPATNADANVVTGNLAAGNGQNGMTVARFSDTGPTSDQNVIQGNFIGTDQSGTTALPNGANGVELNPGANQTLIGGTTAEARNVISGNRNTGIHISGGDGNVMRGNYVGTDRTGTFAIPNGGDGIGVDSGATSTVIGGTTAEARNVLSGNGSYGVELVDGVTGAVIEGNYIGTNATGTAALGNFTDGVRVAAASSDTIGGTAPGAGNVISGNGTGHDCCNVTGAGVGLIGVSAITVEGNLVGTDASGAYAIPNTSGGVQLFQNVSNTVIGGTTAAARNVISGNGDTGIRVGTGSGNLILGNYVGTNAAGTAALGNAVGVSLDGTNHVIRGNVISGNNGNAVNLNSAGGPASGNTIAGNFIGTNPAGSAAIPNLAAAVALIGSSVSQNTVGGTTAADRNVISGNQFSAIRLANGTWGNTIQGNYVGLAADGSTRLGNGASGVIVVDGGNDDPAKGNVIADNVVSANGSPNNPDLQSAGILLLGNSRGNRVQGNKIGTDAAGNPGFGNDFAGVLFMDGVHDNVVGGTAAGAANTIASNLGAGVVLFACDPLNPPLRNRISRNSIFGNLAGRGDFCGPGGPALIGLGIDLGGDGVTPNDPGDGDTGPNQRMNFPVLTKAQASSTKLTIDGSIDAPNPQTVTIEFFASTSGDASGYGEGRTYLGSATPDSKGKIKPTLAPVPAGTVITATATDAAGNTSEFSADVTAK